MNTRNIELFLDLTKTESFTLTAMNLHTTQPTVTRAIQLMEEELGTRLFYRTKRIVRLTDEGRAYKKLFEKWMRELDALREKIKQKQISKKSEAVR